MEQVREGGTTEKENTLNDNHLHHWRRNASEGVTLTNHFGCSFGE